MWRELCVAVAVLGLGSPALSQVVGATLSGTIVDATGARVPGVSLTLTNLASGRQQIVASGEQGEYRAVALQPAAYRVIAVRDGFRRVERDVTLAVGTETRLDFTLAIGEFATTLVVPADIGIASSAQVRPSSLVAASELA